jgi:hypothetical protein
MKRMACCVNDSYELSDEIVIFVLQLCGLLYLYMAVQP